MRCCGARSTRNWTGSRPGRTPTRTTRGWPGCCAKHRDSVLRFLDHDFVDATNNLAEREGRPAVIARKLSAGNRTEAGAETHAALASVFRTYRRQGRDILEAVVELLRQGPGHVLEFDHTAQPIPAL